MKLMSNDRQYYISTLTRTTWRTQRCFSKNLKDRIRFLSSLCFHTGCCFINESRERTKTSHYFFMYINRANEIFSRNLSTSLSCWRRETINRTGGTLSRLSASFTSQRPLGEWRNAIYSAHWGERALSERPTKSELMRHTHTHTLTHTQRWAPISWLGPLWSSPSLSLPPSEHFHSSF